MAVNGFVLQLTDGTSTIDFMTGDYALEDGGLVISPPEQVQTWTDPTQTVGPQLVDSRNGNRTVSINFSITNTLRKAIRQDINLVNDLLRRAIEHSLGLTKARVTLKYAWDQADSVDNFEVLSGQLTMPENVLSVEQMHGKVNGKYCIATIQLNLVVSPVAYGLSPSTDSLIEIPLTNRNGTRVLGGIPITDWVDTGQVSRRSLTVNKAGGGTEIITFWNDNFVELAAQDIVGDAPGKFLIEIRDSLCTNKMDRVTIGAGEKVAGQLQWYWKDSGVAFMSGGQEYITYLNHFLGQSIWRFAGGPVTGEGNAIWSITINDPSVYANKRYRVLWVGGNTPPSNDYFKPDFPVKLVIRAVNGTNTPNIWEGTPTTIKSTQNGWALTWDLGVVTLPPYSEMMQNPGPIQLVAYPAGTEAQSTDFLFYGYVLLLPVDQGYRVLSAPSGGSMVNGVGGYPMMPGTNVNNYLVDDGWSDVTYIRQDNGKTFGYVQAQYAPLSLEPNKTHRIYFHFMGNQLYPSDQDMYMVRIYYAPAYLGGL